MSMIVRLNIYRIVMYSIYNTMYSIYNTVYTIHQSLYYIYTCAYIHTRSNVLMYTVYVCKDIDGHTIVYVKHMHRAGDVMGDKEKDRAHKFEKTGKQVSKKQIVIYAVYYGGRRGVHLHMREEYVYMYMHAASSNSVGNFG